MNNGLSIDELVREFARKREFDEIVSGRRRLGCSDIASPRQSVDEIMFLSVWCEYRKLVDNQIMALTDDEEDATPELDEFDEEDATPELDEFIESIEKNFDFHLNRRR